MYAEKQCRYSGSRTFDPVVSRKACDSALLHARRSKGIAGTKSMEVSNKTRLPDHLKTSVENLSGYSFDDVRVHYNSSKPAQLRAHAYTQGGDIYVAPGQEKHLSHEVWHVVQQKQGRVQPAGKLKGLNINDNHGLEKEADVMGKNSEIFSQTSRKTNSNILKNYSNNTIQRKVKCEMKRFTTINQINDLIDLISPEANRLNVNIKDPVVRKILSSWIMSPVVHDFDIVHRDGRIAFGNEYLVMALKKAVEEREIKDNMIDEPLFTSGNLRFCTKAENREPTLYFRDDGRTLTGRLRQKHPRGPLAERDGSPSHDIFFEKKEEYEEFYRNYGNDGLRTIGRYSTSETPVSGYYHFEYWNNAHHFSEGTARVVALSESEVQRIYDEIVGVASYDEYEGSYAECCRII